MVLLPAGCDLLKPSSTAKEKAGVAALELFAHNYHLQTKASDPLGSSSVWHRRVIPGFLSGVRTFNLSFNIAVLRLVRH